MKRTQIYISEAHDRRLAELAHERGMSKAALIRSMLDRALETGDPEAEARAVIRASAGVLADHPDWPQWLAEVRGQSADERIRSVGL